MRVLKLQLLEKETGQSCLTRTRVLSTGEQKEEKNITKSCSCKRRKLREKLKKSEQKKHSQASTSHPLLLGTYWYDRCSLCEVPVSYIYEHNVHQM